MTEPSKADGSLAGRVALVTGGTAGIGRAVVERFARDGAAVVTTGRREERGREVTEAMREAGLDVTLRARSTCRSRDDCRRAVAATVERHGRLDIVVNNAAILYATSVEETTDEAWDEVIRTNLTSVFLVSKAAIPHLRAAGGGSIVNFASVHAHATVVRLAAYAAAKGGVVALSRQMAHDLVADQIRVNAVVIGAVATDMSRRHGELLGNDMPSGGFVDR